MSTLTSNANNNNNNNLISNNASSAQLSSTTTTSATSNNNNPNAINNNNNPAGAPTTQHSHHHLYQSALASGVRGLFTRSMSSTSANGAGGVGSTSGGASAAGGSATAATPASAIPAELNVMLHGYHRKLKTNKKKYFVVYGDTPDKSARLEYFDSEKKFKQSWLKSTTSVQAKRSIVLRSCFNINKRHDIKKHVIALYTKDDCFCIVFDSEEELNRWLRTLLSLQRGEESEGEPPRPTFEHVWDVFVERKGLGDSCGILGTYRLCITDKTLSLVRIGPPTTNSGDARVEVVEFSLASIRRCGASQRYFYLEVGRSSKIGPGEIWMEAPDAIIAHNMHTTIMKPTKNREVDGLGPIPRNRSSSANAASKPTQTLGRRQTYTGQKPVNCSPSGVTSAVIFHQRALSLPSATPMLSHSPHHNSTAAHMAKQKSSQSIVGSSSNVSSNPSSNGPLSGGGGFFGKNATGGIVVDRSIQPVHHRTRSLPLTEESAIRVTYNGTFLHPHSGGGQQTQHNQLSSIGNRKHQQSSSLSIASLKCTCPSSGALPIIVVGNSTRTSHYNLCPLHGSAAHSSSPSSSSSMAAAGSTRQQDYENMNKSCSYLPSSSPPDQQHYYNNHLFEGTDSNHSAIATTLSRSSMESIIEDQKYLPMNMKKPTSAPSSHQPSTTAGGSQEEKDLANVAPNLQFISRLLRSSQIQTANNSKLAALKMATATGGNNNGAGNISSSSSSGSNSTSSNLHGSTTTGTGNGTAIHAYCSSTGSGGTLPKGGTSPPGSLRRRSGRNSTKSRRSAAIARERCDSLPSRNRTTSETSTHQQQLIMNSGGMPPPRTIPSASFNRPQSMIVNRQSHSHSPPVHSSPLSPPSGACSTGSDGSSFSIDEPDSYNSSHTPDEGNGFPKVINHLSSGCSIPEENSEEYINNYGKVPLRSHTQHRSMDEFVNNAIRRGSPAPTANIVSSVDGTGNYMEMYSPSGSSPGDPSGNSGYIPMSPSTDFPRGLYSSSAHSRTSSLAEDTVDAYVPMAAPGHNAEEYVDMDPSHNSSNRTLAAATTSQTTITTAGGNGNISSAASSCSITSGTPSTDMRFSGYHLDKVEARFTPSEDDEMERPLRTYSVGSRLEHNKRKLRVDMLSSEGSSNSRVRAFSVGSRAKVPRSDVYKGSGAPITAPLLSASSSGSLQETSSNSGSITNCAPGASTNSRGSNSSMNEGRTGKKSSSAPTLAPKPHGSFDPIMDDLMEIDYSAPQFHGEPAVSSSTPQKTSGMEDYMEMTAGGNKKNTGYVEMKPGHIPPVVASSLENSDYLDMRPGTGYEPNPSTKSKSSPIKISSPKKFSSGGNNNNNYLEMSPRMMGTSSSSSSSIANRKSAVPSEDYLNISPLMMTSAGGDSGNEEKMINEEEDEEEVVAPSSAPDVYMEMTWSQPKTNLKLDCSKPASDDYINMDYSRKEGGSSALDPRMSSMPIAIQSGSAGRTLQGDLMEPKIGGAPSNIPNYLPLNSSATRHQVAAQIGFSPKQNSLRSRCDSRDSGIVTPSGSQVTIFPFSPGSPIKSFSLGVEPSAEERKCFVDATTGTLRISETDEDNSEESNEFLAVDQQQPSQPKDATESSKLEDLSHNYAELSIGHQQQQQQQQQQTQQKTEKSSHPSSFSSTKKANLSLILTTSTNTRTTPTVTAMKSAVEYPDYVNCTPVTTPVITKPTTPMAVDDQAGDYAIMNPASLRKLSSTSQSELASTESGLPPLTKKSNQIFKPITSSQDEAFLKKSGGASPKPAFSRQYSERRAGPSGIDSSGYEMLQRTSRPNSVNSEKITNKCPPSVGSTRPSSANSDRLPIISATSSSASSTSTLCESKNQSPTASSMMIATTTTTTTPGVRPDSVTSLTDPHIISRPPSVSSERELHYASLDLPPCTNPPQSAPAVGAVVVPPNRMEVDSDTATASRPGGPDSLNSSPSPNSGCTSQQQTGSAFTYAQIDFVRSVAQAQAQQQQQQSLTKSGQQQQ